MRRSYHMGTYGQPKTMSAERTVTLYPQTVAILRSILPLDGDPDQPVFTDTTGGPIEPKAFSTTGIGAFGR